jgi:hypothetical protein
MKLVLCFSNAQDSGEVKKFKSYALKHHEHFNGLLNQFAVLDRGPEKFSMCFEAQLQSSASTDLSLSALCMIFKQPRVMTNLHSSIL